MELRWIHDGKLVKKQLQSQIDFCRGNIKLNRWGSKLFQPTHNWAEHVTLEDVEKNAMDDLWNISHRDDDFKEIRLNQLWISSQYIYIRYIYIYIYTDTS